MTSIKCYNLRIEDVAGHMPEVVRWELVEGELRLMSPSNPQHGHVAATIGSFLHQHVRKHRLGRVYGAETGFVLGRGPDTLRAPDAAFIAADRVQDVTEGFYPGPPDLAVEVVSPNDTIPEIDDKVEWWLSRGAREVWVVWPKTKSVVVHGRGKEPIPLGPNDTVDGGEVLPGFSCVVREFFE